MKLISSCCFERYTTEFYLSQLSETFIGIDLLVVDENTQHFAPDNIEQLCLPAGEEQKNFPSLESILRRCSELKLTRKSYIAALGGGVLCDLTALAASLYMRGCQLILIPSTLLAMVDAAIGGKTGIDFQGYKNLVGTFYPAKQLRLVPELLTTLPASEYRSGLAEIIKHALLKGGKLYNLLQNKKAEIERREPALLEDLLVKASLVKADIIEQDLYEEHIRAHLNLGHTFAHALESVSGLGTISHGQAVAWGLVQATTLSYQLGFCSKDYLQQVREMILAYGFKLDYDYNRQLFLEALHYDKKRQKKGMLRFVLQRQLAETFVYELAWDQFINFFKIENL